VTPINKGFINFGCILNDAISVAWLYSFDNRMTSEWWWTDETNTHALSGIRIHVLSVQVITTHASYRPNSETGKGLINLVTEINVRGNYKKRFVKMLLNNVILLAWIIFSNMKQVTPFWNIFTLQLGQCTSVLSRFICFGYKCRILP
jgi:hypothetical protein